MAFETNDKKATTHATDVEAQGDKLGPSLDEYIARDQGLYGKLQRTAGMLKVEQRGIERVPENERTDNKYPLLNTTTMWLSVNMNVASIALGTLSSSVFYLGFVDSVLAILFFNIIGIIPVSYFSALGPRYGLRQVVLSRYWFGWHGAKLVAFFNILCCIGWSAVNSIVGAQLLHATNSNVPGWAAIVIIGVCTLTISLFGYKVVHAYEFWSWLPTFIAFLITLGLFAHSGAFVDVPMGVGRSEMGNILSFGAAIFGFVTSWAVYAADYTVYQPVDIGRRKVFVAAFIGLFVPLLFCQILGCALMTAASQGNNKYASGYKSAGVGGLLAAVLTDPLGDFGRFLLVILALSMVANNCPNMYSVAFNLQFFCIRLRRVPRFVWTPIATAVYIAIAIPGYSHFATVLNDFLNFIGYFLAMYEGIGLCEHFIFKKALGGYNLLHYDSSAELPLGVAAVSALLFGIAGMVTGMSQKWWVGPIALHAGKPPYGGDVGFELSFAFSVATYLIFRKLELSYTHR